MRLIVQLSSVHATDMTVSTGSCQVHVTVSLCTGVVLSYSDDDFHQVFQGNDTKAYGSNFHRHQPIIWQILCLWDRASS